MMVVMETQARIERSVAVLHFRYAQKEKRLAFVLSNRDLRSGKTWWLLRYQSICVE